MKDIKVGAVLVCKRFSQDFGYPSIIGEKAIIEEIIYLQNFHYVIISNNKGKWNFPIESLRSYFETLQDHRRKIIEYLI